MSYDKCAEPGCSMPAQFQTTVRGGQTATAGSRYCETHFAERVSGLTGLRPRKDAPTRGQMCATPRCGRIAWAKGLCEGCLAEKAERQELPIRATPSLAEIADARRAKGPTGRRPVERCARWDCYADRVEPGPYCEEHAASYRQETVRSRQQARPMWMEGRVDYRIDRAAPDNSSKYEILDADMDRELRWYTDQTVTPKAESSAQILAERERDRRIKASEWYEDLQALPPAAAPQRTTTPRTTPPLKLDKPRQYFDD